MGSAPAAWLWIRPATQHNVRMVGAVSMQSLYLEPDAVPSMPTHCQVVGISPLMRSLMTEALNLPLEYELDGRAGALMELIQHEMRQLPVLPLSLQYPTHGPLAERCRQFVQRPSIHETIDDWSKALGMSRRAFTRLFRRETGLSFVAWRQQACLLCAMPPSGRRRTCDHGCNRSGLRESGRVHAHVQAGLWKSAPHLPWAQKHTGSRVIRNCCHDHRA